MHSREVISEAWRNLWTGVTHALVLAAAFALGIGGLVAFDVRAIVDANAFLDRWRDSGASVMVLDAPGAVDGAACEALQQVDGITAAGAGRITSTEQLPLPTLPLAAPVYAEVTPGFARLVATSASGARTAHAATADSLAAGGLLLSDSLAETVDRGPGTRLATDLGDALVAGAYATPDDGRSSRLGYAALAQVPAQGRFDFCWAEVWPPDPFLTNLLYSVVSPTQPDAEPKTGQLNPTLGTGLRAHALYDLRGTRLMPVAVAIVAWILGFMSARLRRLEIASALNAGVTHRAMSLQFTVETGVWAVCGVLLASPWIWFAAHAGNPLPAAPILPLAVAGLVSGVAGAIVGTLTSLAITREEHLFRYFKNR